MVWEKATKASLPRLISSHLMTMIDFKHHLAYTHKEKPGGSKNKTIEKQSLAGTFNHCRRGMRRDIYRYPRRQLLDR